jgi:hypothetical protein
MLTGFEARSTNCVMVLVKERGGLELIAINEDSFPGCVYSLGIGADSNYD